MHLIDVLSDSHRTFLWCCKCDTHIHRTCASVGSEDISNAGPHFCRCRGGNNLAKDLLGHGGEDEAQDLLIQSEPLVVHRVGFLEDVISLLDVNLSRWSQSFAIDMALQSRATDCSKHMWPP
jgi:hypothetical protein